MPKKALSSGRVNKSEMVRTELLANPELGPSAISEALKPKGILVSPNFVSNIKLKMKKANGEAPGKRGRKPNSVMATVASVKTAPGGNGFDRWVSAAAFIKECGSVKDARLAFDAAANVLEAGGMASG